MRSPLLLLLLLSPACAPTTGPAPDRAPLQPAAQERAPDSAQSPAPDLDALLLRLASLELSFVDPETHEIYRAGGPFTVAYWDANTVELVGSDPDAIGATQVTVTSDGPRLWALARVRDREFLVRLD